MPVIDKSKIIEAIQHTEDERILFAINRLLQIDEDGIPQWHKEILDERLKSIEEGTNPPKTPLPIWYGNDMEV